MKPAPIAALFVALLTAKSFSPGQPPGGATDAALDALAADVKKARSAALLAALEQLDKASASPRAAQDFFFESVKKLDFKRDLEEAGKFEEWKRSFLTQWRGHDLGIVLQLQLRHQALVIRSAGASDQSALVPA